MNVLKPHLQTTVLTLLTTGKSLREIARIYRKTILGLKERVSTEPADSFWVTTGPVIQIPTPRPPEPDRQSISACEPHRAVIQAQLGLHRKFTASYEEMVDQFDFSASYDRVKRFADRLIDGDAAQFDRLEFAAGDEVQIDYGQF